MNKTHKGVKDKLVFSIWHTREYARSFWIYHIFVALIFIAFFIWYYNFIQNTIIEWELEMLK